jgi:soluble lytic murein transglycosylase-like protein
MKLAQIITNTALQTGINPQLLAALIHQESSGNPYAVRYEPAFLKRYLESKTKKTIGGHVPSQCSWQTEVQMRATSFGLMQIMGQVARERGFQGEFLTELCDPAVNLKWGSEFLQTLLHKHDTTEKALLRWNGGGDPDYAKKILRHIESGAYHYLLVG